MLKQNFIMTASVDIPMWIGEISQDATLGEELQVINGSQKRGESVLFRDKSPDRLSNPKSSVLNTYPVKQY